jgi:hypothetical protein
MDNKYASERYLNLDYCSWELAGTYMQKNINFLSSQSCHALQAITVAAGLVSSWRLPVVIVNFRIRHDMN